MGRLKLGYGREVNIRESSDENKIEYGDENKKSRWMIEKKISCRIL
jgi:hypothetical protein